MIIIVTVKIFFYKFLLSLNFMSSSNSENPMSAFDETLEDILELLEEDAQHFIYLTGAAGTGKTTLIERVKDECLLKKMVVAPTGVAALNIGGSTINSAFRIGFDTFPVIQESKDPRFKKLLKNLELLIIDEISMVRAPMLDAISETLQIPVSYTHLTLPTKA